MIEENRGTDMRIMDALPDTRYTLHLEFDYAGELDEFGEGNREYAIEELLSDTRFFEEMLVERGIVDVRRLKGVRAYMTYDGEMSPREIAPAYPEGTNIPLKDKLR